jgi:hypothetical protein
LPSRRLITSVARSKRQIIAALRRQTVTIRRIRDPIPHWEAPHEVHPGEWQDTLPAIPLCDVQSGDPDKLPAGSRNPSDLLRSQMLRRPLQKRGPASRKNGAGVMNSWRPDTPGLWPDFPDLLDAGQSPAICLLAIGTNPAPKTTSTVAGRTMR